MNLLGPAVKAIDEQVAVTLESQDGLRQQIDLLQRGVRACSLYELTLLCRNQPVPGTRRDAPGAGFVCAEVGPRSRASRGHKLPPEQRAGQRYCFYIYLTLPGPSEPPPSECIKIFE